MLSEDAFGHSGFGGSIGFADPRGQSLVDATYPSLGYREERGSWVRR